MSTVDIELNWPEITVDTPMDEIKRIHQKIWQYVVDHGYKPETLYRGSCVLCEYDMLLNLDTPQIPYYKCLWCPFFKENTIRKLNPYRHCLGGLFALWDTCIMNGDFEYAKEIAKQIRDIEICTDEEMRERMKELREKYTPSNEV